MGPYLMEPKPDSMLVKWEIQGEKASEILVKDGSGDERRFAGRIETPDKLTVKLPGRMYLAELQPLEPCTTYPYRLDPFETGFPHSFKTPPLVGKLCAGGMRFAVFGDSRFHDDRHAKVIAELEKHEPQLLLNVGDIVNAAIQILEWQRFFRIEASVVSKAPMAIAAGNHEAYLGEDFGGSMMNRYFGVPHRTGTGHYSFDYGPVHFIILDLYWGASMSRAGAKWLEEDLKRVPEDQYIFIISHEPFFSFSRHRVTRALKALRPMMTRYKVDAVCAGHSHVYERVKADGAH